MHSWRISTPAAGISAIRRARWKVRSKWSREAVLRSRARRGKPIERASARKRKAPLPAAKRTPHQYRRQSLRLLPPRLVQMPLHKQVRSRRPLQRTRARLQQPSCSRSHRPRVLLRSKARLPLRRGHRVNHHQSKSFLRPRLLRTNPHRNHRQGLIGPRLPKIRPQRQNQTWRRRPQAMMLSLRR